MHKPLKTFFIILLSLILCYSVGWFVYGIFLKHTLIKEIFALNCDDLRITYNENIKLAGYPNKISLGFSEVKVIGATNIMQADKVQIVSNLLLSKLTFNVTKLQFNIANNYLNFAFKDATQIKIKFQNNLLFAKKALTLANLWHEIDHLSLHDSSGISISTPNLGQIIYQASQTTFNLRNKAADNLFSEVSLQMQEKVDASLLIYYLPEFAGIKSIKINFFDLYYPNSSIKLAGDIVNSNNFRNLNGEMKVSLYNYTDILENMQQQGLIPQGEAIKNVLQKISNADHSAKDLSFAIINHQGGDFKIGNMNLAQLLFYYYYHQ
jgi:hypothetical protein